MTEELEFVTYCGLYCNLCGARARIPQRAKALYEAMEEEGWTSWGHDIPGFTEFWSFLEKLDADGSCPGCRAGGGWPDCPMRICARERGLELCNQCPEFPCAHVEELAARYPTLISGNRHMQAVGLESWLEEKKEQVRRSVVYADTRHALDEHG